MKESLTDEDLAKLKEHRFYVTMSLKDRLAIRDNMQNLKTKHDISLSKLFRKVMLEFMNDDDFLRYIGLLK